MRLRKPTLLSALKPRVGAIEVARTTVCRRGLRADPARSQAFASHSIDLNSGVELMTGRRRIALPFALAIPVLLFVMRATTVRASAPPGRFDDPNDGTVKDTKTGLVWQKGIPSTISTCTTDSTHVRCTWSEATNYCKNLGLAGTGWRLPTVLELSSLVDETIPYYSGPTIDQTAFPSTPADSYWTSSPLAGSSSSAWSVNFNGGDTSNKGVTNTYRVRCVH